MISLFECKCSKSCHFEHDRLKKSIDWQTQDLITELNILKQRLYVLETEACFKIGKCEECRKRSFKEWEQTNGTDSGK